MKSNALFESKEIRNAKRLLLAIQQELIDRDIEPDLKTGDQGYPVLAFDCELGSSGEYADVICTSKEHTIEINCDKLEYSVDFPCDIHEIKDIMSCIGEIIRSISSAKTDGEDENE